MKKHAGFLFLFHALSRSDSEMAKKWAFLITNEHFMLDKKDKQFYNFINGLLKKGITQLAELAERLDNNNFCI